ncbi:WD40 repeat-containing protein [Heterostelium album PN500]|uniref:WD40 repeat-containing protein SMU1 n=1 Tax=Heterostelium pallidum (strain ATCC 26659 / Pp 5 / PN500) TaxID=670386 RepID=D3AVM8_HETP5|nr:WD40 repeat-containing protein [Heterostelium album PN500]EFA86351.1 WD40 repeat-containing protein [Heterostelium album PN500]|eukprot:XP_020438456.1 WD40 repeat-containing protein [Heterostelium album PN500]
MSSNIDNALEVQSRDVIKLILQFCKENALNSTVSALQEETGVNLNTIDNVDRFLEDVKHGQWDKVIMDLSYMNLTPSLSVDLYEQIIAELLDMGELDLAKSLLRKSDAMNYLKLNNVNRYLRLEHYLQRGNIDLVDFYEPGIDTYKRRAQLAVELSKEINASEVEAIPTTLDRTIKYQEKNHPECCRFSPDAQYLVTGSVDGYIEVWNYQTGKLANNLDYQANDEFMMHDKSIMCLNFSKDGDKNATQILTGSFDGTLKILGLKSGKALKVFRGHNSYVNDCFITENEERVISCSSDATVRIWDAKNAECLQTIRPTQSVKIKEISIRFVLPMKNPDNIVICNSSPTIVIMSVRTQNITKQFTLDNNKNFVCCTLSPQQNFLYAVAEDNIMYCFRVDTAELVQSFEIHSKEVIGLSHHPNRNLIASFSADCTVKTWKAIKTV